MYSEYYDSAFGAVAGEGDIRRGGTKMYTGREGVIHFYGTTTTTTVGPLRCRLQRGVM